MLSYLINSFSCILHCYWVWEFLFVVNIVSPPNLWACFRDDKRHPARPRSRAIEARLSSSMLFASLSKQRYLASLETVSAFPLARATPRSVPSHQPALWPCPWRLWASLDVRKTLLGPVFCELRSALPPRLRVPEPSICFCWALEMPSAGPNAIKQGKNWFSGPFLGGGLSEALRGLRQHCDDAWEGHFRRGSLSQSLLASSRVPESTTCFPCVAEVLFGAPKSQNMLPLGCRNASGKAKYWKTREKAKFILKRVGVCAGGGGPEGFNFHL